MFSRFIPIFFFLFSYTIAPAQEIYDLLKNIKLNGKIQSVEENTYKAVVSKGKIEKGEKITWVESDIIRIRDYYVVYNENHAILELREPCNTPGGTTADVKRQENSDGYTVTEILKANCKYFTKIISVFDKKDRILSKRHFEENKTYPRIQTVFKYTTDGKKLSETDTLFYEDTGKKYPFTSNYVYDDKGKLVQKNEPDRNYKTYYSYTMRDSLYTEKKIYKDEQPMKKIVYDYDNYGRKTKKTEYYGNGKVEWELVYNERGNILSVKRYNENDTLSHALSYKYNERGNETEKTHFNGNMHADYKHVYVYDKKNRLIKKTDYDSQGSHNGTDTLVTHTVYRYNKNGDIKQVVSKEVYNGNSTGKQVFKYKYDKYKNWIVKSGYLNYKPVFIQERTITYFN